MMEGYKIILEFEIPLISWMILKKHSNGADNAQKSSIINGSGLYQIMLPNECKQELLMSREPLFP